MGLSVFPVKTGGVPSGNTASRPSSPVIGDTFYNGQNNSIEIYTGTEWVLLSAPPTPPTIASVTDIGTDLAYATGGTFVVVVDPATIGGKVDNFNAATTSGGFSASSSSTTITMSGLTSNTSFAVTAGATNKFGQSSQSNSFANVTATTVPQAPTIGTATIFDNTTDVAITWTLGNTGGKNLSSITITPFLNGVTAGTPQTAATTSSTSHSFTGLTSGSAYTFKVKATNANGTSLDSAATNSITVPTFQSIDILLVAGGGGAGGSNNNWANGGGGGAGGLLGYNNILFTPAATYTVTVGNGGGGGTGNVNGTNGGNSNVTGTGISLTAALGGGGGAWYNGTGDTGGSGGGGGSAVGSGTSGQGFSGGSRASLAESGGGGGAGEAGSTDGTGHGGDGVDTYSSWGSATTSGQNIDGTYWFAGGGTGGSQSQFSGQGGNGGGANRTSYGGSGNAGTANTGGGGGAASNNLNGPNTGGAGGSGIVILRTAGTYTAASTTGSPTRVVTGGYTYYKFTGNGSITI